MSETKQSEVGESAYTVKIIQLAIISIAALGFYFVVDGWASLSTLYGGGIALVYTTLLGRNVASAEVKKGSEQVALYLGAVVRFVSVALLLIVGLGWIKFNALATVIGFSSAQLAYVACLGIAIKKKD